MYSLVPSVNLMSHATTPSSYMTWESSVNVTLAHKPLAVCTWVCMRCIHVHAVYVYPASATYYLFIIVWDCGIRTTKTSINSWDYTYISLTQLTFSINVLNRTKSIGDEIFSLWHHYNVSCAVQNLTHIMRRSFIYVVPHKYYLVNVREVAVVP